MPEQDALAAIGQRSETLLHHAMESVEICQVYAAAMSVLEDTAAEKGARTITIGEPAITDRRIIAHVQFSTLALPAATHAMPRSTSSFLAWAAQDAERLHDFMRANPDTIRYLGDLVRIVDAYARHKGVKFAGVKFAEAPAPFLDPDGYLVLEIDDKAKTENWLRKLDKLWKGR